MSMPRYSVIESAAMISAFNRSATSSASADLPEAVGPVRINELAKGEEVTAENRRRSSFACGRPVADRERIPR